MGKEEECEASIHCDNKQYTGFAFTMFKALTELLTFITLIRWGGSTSGGRAGWLVAARLLAQSPECRGVPEQGTSP